MNWWTNFKQSIVSWFKRNIADDVPVGMEDEFSDKYRK